MLRHLVSTLHATATTTTTNSYSITAMDTQREPSHITLSTAAIKLSHGSLTHTFFNYTDRGLQRV